MTQFEIIKKELADYLGVPYYVDDQCAVFCVDTLKAQHLLPSGIFDLVITSPPYNIGKEYESIMPVDDYVQWTNRWATETCRLIADYGAFLLNIGYIPVEAKGRAVPLPYLLWNKIPLYLNQEIVWNYSAGVACKNYLSPRNEKVLWYVKDKDHYVFNLDAIRDPNVKYPNSKRHGKPRVNTLGKNPSDVWEIAKVTTGAGRSSAERTAHPCQFPADLIDRLVLGFSQEGGIVFDPFVGSGTTIESCLRHSRYCVGFEIREDYCDIAVDRIREYRKQSAQMLFFEEERQYVTGKR
jgi:adenine-specific DNA-methyltransferase